MEEESISPHEYLSNYQGIPLLQRIDHLIKLKKLSSTEGLKLAIKASKDSNLYL